MEKGGKIWDVVVIGGGPAGMMAAGRAGERGLRVLLIEKNETLGKKLLITGGGRCNVTNAEMDVRKLLAKFKDADKFLFSAFSQWSSNETLEFFHSRGMSTKIENELRAFPTSNKAQSVWDVLVDYMRQGNVSILSNSPVSKIVQENNVITEVQLKNGKKIVAKSFVLATGGLSRPETGSTGDGFLWLKELGHIVHDSNASLVPIAIKNTWIKPLSGLTLPLVKITTLQSGAKQEVKKGKLLFTHVGLSGPTILNMSKEIGELLKYGEVEISIDLLPSHDHGTLNQALQELFAQESNKKCKNALGTLIPSALVSIVLGHAAINPDIACHSMTREARLALIEAIKDLRMQVERLLGDDKAIVTSGGVDLQEVDFKTMRSKLIKNLYLVGDILNIDRPSGGYSLQLCWTTGFVAGNSM